MTDRVLVGDCGDGSLVEALVAAGVDAYGVDPSDLALEPALDRGLDVRAETVLDHLDVVADEALGGIVLTGSVQWLRPNERERLLDLRLVPSRGGRRAGPPLDDPGGLGGLGVARRRGTWRRAARSTRRPGPTCSPRRGFAVTATVRGGDDRRLARVGEPIDDAAAVNAAIDTINDLLLGPTEYLVVATRER